MSPLVIADSRLAEGMGLYSILSLEKPSEAAIHWATWMSKPLYSPVAASLKPRPGWSCLTPILIFPFDLIVSNVGLPEMDTFWATVNGADSVLGAVVEPPPPPHALSERAS